MDTNTAIESFISKCDDMMIAEESLIDTIKRGFIKFFTGVITFFMSIIRKLPSGNLKQKAVTFSVKAKNGLNKSKDINNTTTEEEINDIKLIGDEVTKAINETKNEMERIAQKGNKCMSNINADNAKYVDELKTIAYNMTDTINKTDKTNEHIGKLLDELRENN